MNINQNWNDMSSSSSDSADESPVKPLHLDEDDPIKTSDKNQIENHNQKEQTSEVKAKAEDGNRGEVIYRRQQRKRTFLTDDELLEKYQKKEVDDPKAIKVSRCINQQARQVIKSLKTAIVKEINDSTFLLFFQKQEDLIDFFKEKIAKRYKFYFNMFEKRERKEDDRFKRDRKDTYKGENRRPERRNTRNSQDDQKQESKKIEIKKEQKVLAEAEEKIQKRKKKYESSSQSQENVPKKQTNQPKQNIKEQPKIQKQVPQSKGEVRQRKITSSKLQFQIHDNSNIILIHTDTFDPHKVLETISRKKITKQFSKIHVKTPFFAFPQVATLLVEIKKFNFFLEKEPPMEAEADQEFELVLIEKGTNNTDSFYDRFHKMTILTNEPNMRMLGKNIETYFEDIQRYNISEITQGFDPNQYIIRLKEAALLIQKHWKTWKVEAQQDYIQHLLKLSYRIKKATNYTVQLKPSSKAEKSYLTAELHYQKERRPKVDVSNVNNYLN